MGAPAKSGGGAHLAFDVASLSREPGRLPPLVGLQDFRSRLGSLLDCRQISLPSGLLLVRILGVIKVVCRVVLAHRPHLSAASPDAPQDHGGTATAAATRRDEDLQRQLGGSLLSHNLHAITLTHSAVASRRARPPKPRGPTVLRAQRVRNRGPHPAAAVGELTGCSAGVPRASAVDVGHGRRRQGGAAGQLRKRGGVHLNPCGATMGQANRTAERGRRAAYKPSG